MQGFQSAKTLPVLGLILAVPGLGGCNTYGPTSGGTGTTLAAKPVAVTDEERDCLGRAMYFESNRSDSEGLLAVGTVVMNRLEAAAFPNGGICSVVGQPRQFAPGVLTKKMDERSLQKVAEVTDAVLDGKRHPKVGRAMYFHTAGLRFPYNNMHYVAVAGGNAFYEKRKPGAVAQAAPPTALAFAAAEPPATPVATSPTLVVPPAVAPSTAASPALSASPAGAPNPAEAMRSAGAMNSAGATSSAEAMSSAAVAGPASASPEAGAKTGHTTAASKTANSKTANSKTAASKDTPSRTPEPKAVAKAHGARNRLALTPAALAPEPPPPTVLNLPRP
ncbi:hypothetical protein ASF60_06970 [Methylobacterium sp. Leaf113]|uniref:cell wall hydrolase n=1 Tax=Methylobacterium sp. Leaf113 TaxID=1736259 RepID=UPI0006F4940F|nr:cell wall hydrolase [Methylobacterium sp. Leaf113]KQP77691.1 hypothetical protein ASF60_06970 [Methylobacterium sp. Leaf113]